MPTATSVDKAVVVATLRARDLHARADWVEKEFPALIDTARNASLLQTLGINLDTLADSGASEPITKPETTRA